MHFRFESKPEEILNVRALVIDLNAVSDITMDDTDISNSHYILQKMKLALDSMGFDLRAIRPDLQQLIICPTRLRKAWLERFERGLLLGLSEPVFFDTLEAAVAAVPPEDGVSADTLGGNRR